MDNYELEIIDARTILGAAPDELLSDAAQRVVESSQVQREAMGARLGLVCDG
jgi:hypothetical protein